ncbi:uncharacterized protein [Ptychodera flava]|uniref:uncharacterized protein n=1 Tax=Ptychodera flava TaxID=63121 RepID=UPI003969C2B4
MATKPDNTSGFCNCHHECNNTSDCTWKYLNYDSDLHHGSCAVKYYNMEFLGVCGNCGKMVASDHDIKPGRRQCHTGTTDSKDDGLCQIDSANEHAKLLTTSKDKSTKVLLKQPITNREVVKTLADYRRTEKCSNSSEAKDFDWLKTKTVIDDVIALNQSADQCQQKESRGDNHECNEDAISSMLQDDNTSKCKGNDTPGTLTDKCTSDITDKGVKNGDIIDEFVRTGDITVECVQTSDITTECVKTSDITAKCVPVQTNDITAKCVQTNGITAKCVQTNDITAKCVQTSES